MVGSNFVQIAADSTGKRLETFLGTGSAGAEVHREVFILGFQDFSLGPATATSVGGNTMVHIASLMSSGVSAQQAGTWTVQQGVPPWSVSQSGTWNINQLTSILSSVGVAATQAGTWTVQQGGAPWSVTFPSAQQVTVTNSVGTHPVTIEGQPVAVSQSGTWTVQQGTPPWSVTNLTSVGTHNVVPQSSMGRILEFAIIQQSALGSTTIVAADASNRIKVVSYALISQPDNYLHWRSDSTPISGPMVMAASSGVSFAGSYPSIAIQTAVNQALNLFATATGSVGGHVAFYREP